MELLLFLAGVFLIIFVIGRLLEWFKIPWIFSALILGLVLAAYNPFEQITQSSDFLLLAQLGMYFLLFIIGFELNVKQMFKSSSFIVKTTFIIIFAEGIIGSLLVHFLFDLPWSISFLLGLSFATVGEAVLIPILDEFKLTKTKFGQTILSIGVLDDAIEIAVIVAASVFLGHSLGHTQMNIWGNLLILLSLFALLFVLMQFKDYFRSFVYKDISSLFFVVIFFLFLFVGLGSFVESAALGALLAGIALKSIIPPKILDEIESEVKTLAYGFLAPIFFVWVGLDVNISLLFAYSWIILLFAIVVYMTKAITSYAVSRKELGSKKAMLLGISLSVRLSTSIVIIKLLFERSFISSEVYSVLVGVQIISQLIIPFMLSYLITKWDVGRKR